MRGCGKGKQCGRNVLMRIDEMTDWATYCAAGNAEELRILAHPYDTAESGPLAERLPGRTIRIAVGPEGGFADDEIESATRNGWRAVSLGPRILRLETAAIVLATHVIGSNV